MSHRGAGRLAATDRGSGGLGEAEGNVLDPFFDAFYFLRRHFGKGREQLGVVGGFGRDTYV